MNIVPCALVFHLSCLMRVGGWCVVLCCVKCCVVVGGGRGGGRRALAVHMYLSSFLHALLSLPAPLSSPVL